MEQPHSPSHSTPQEELRYFHVTSRCHLSAFLLQHEKSCQILAELCLHYARACRIALLNYCFMDNHFHLEVGVRQNSLPLEKMVGLIKREFTVRFKRWFNEEYRPTIRYRQPRMTNGTLWDGGFHAEPLDDLSHLQNCTLYIENNRISAELKHIAEPHDSDQRSSIVLNRLLNAPFQSAAWYLSGTSTPPHLNPLTNGHDGLWATDEEIREYWRKPASALPPGWKRVWFNDQRRILKPPAPSNRQYPFHPFFQTLGDSSKERSLRFGELLVTAFWANHRNRTIEEPEIDKRGFSLTHAFGKVAS